MKRNIFVLMMVMIFCCLLGITSIGYAEEASMIDLGAIGGGTSQPNSINDKGQVVGSYSVKGVCEGERAFIWDKENGMKDLGTLGGSYSCANAINKNGQVIGWSYLLGDEISRAFIWDKENGMKDLGSLGGRCTNAIAINNNGQVVGYSDLPNHAPSHAFIWDKENGMKDLGTLGGSYSCAGGINDSGQVIGGWGYSRAFIWDKENGMKDLGSLGGTTTPTGINNNGQVTGYSYLSWNDVFTSRAFIWDKNNGMINLGTLGGFAGGSNLSQPSDINDKGQIVGYSYGGSFGFIWDKDNGMKDLNTIGGPSLQSHIISINDKSQVAGTYGNNAQYLFIWDKENGMKDLGSLGGSYSLATGLNNNGQVIGYSYLSGDSTYHAFIYNSSVSTNPITNETQFQNILIDPNTNIDSTTKLDVAKLLSTISDTDLKATGTFGNYSVSETDWKRIAYEDLYPLRIDADYNDFVVDIKIQEFFEGDILKAINVKFMPQAKGALYDHLFKMGFSDVYTGNAKRFLWNTNSDGTQWQELEEEDLYVQNYDNKRATTIFDNTSNCFGATNDTKDKWAKNTISNRSEDISRIGGILLIMNDNTSLKTNRSTPSMTKYRPILNVKGMNQDIDVWDYDNDFTMKNGVNTNIEGYPFGMVLPVTWKWPLERVHIKSTYPDFCNNGIYKSEGWFETETPVSTNEKYLFNENYDDTKLNAINHEAFLILLGRPLPADNVTQYWFGSRQFVKNGVTVRALEIPNGYEYLVSGYQLKTIYELEAMGWKIPQEEF